ncbi:receptor-like protein kinase HSL1 [Vigna umbellata]|uniref:receptor-like protein kinase HSL1 n=1 Tax=Vigna umbellata TaxID=87088 RepID=UPI001F5F450E|nr:receptor-like protein kinase HSL1 [Vigna umbellata]
MTISVQSCIHFSCHIFLVLFFFLVHTSSQSLNDQEHAVLLNIKQYLEDPSFLSHWNSTSSHCSWPEITCTTGSVTSLTLSHSNINKTIPSFICDLTNLTHLDFSFNLIPGDFPTPLYNCSKLEYLDLSGNNFDGQVPREIDRLGANLQYLNLGSTNFHGDVPASIGNLKQLRQLKLQFCLLNGTVAAEIDSLPNLEYLDLSSNFLFPKWKLPWNLTKFNKLKVFYLYGTNLVGEIPDNIGDMVALEKLDASKNNLTGGIPSGLFLLKNLTSLYLFQNSLSGEIPSVVDALNLVNLDLATNDLTGKIPDDFGKLQQLEWLSLSLNNLSGVIPQSLGSLPALIDFRVFFNKLSGTLPPDFGRYSKLKTFLIASNNFTGKLPDNLCYHGMLLNLSVYENKLSGELPEFLGNCSSLLDLKIHENEFSGNIPNGLWTSFNLSNFMVSHNKFTGELPKRLSWNVSRFEISYNQFSGGIPSGVSSWTNLVVFDASKNNFNGSIPKELTALPKLITLLLDQNQLTGALPSDIISWKSLVTLNLSQNQLSGQIPHAIAQLPVLSQLDLSENEFSGQVPSLSTRVTNLNLSYNHLTGRIQREFENSAYAGSFLGNSGLCSDNPALNLTLCNSGLQRTSKDSSWSIGLIICLAVAALLLALLASLLFIRFQRKRKKGLDNSWKLVSFQRVNFTESTIVSSMTDQNIIGSGGYGTVYRIDVGSDYVAVKKIWNNRKLDKKLESSFRAEVRILSNIRHTNIVRLMCCISNEDSMLLVYEYLENLSLDKWLHKSVKPGSANKVVLDWPKRLKIAIGVAQGLSYMHHDCLPPVVHRDIKTSNILLDSQFNAKVADFGLAKLLIKPEELSSMSAVIGSFGYIAPEFVQSTRVNEKIDVFSFGVVLLELTTGKEASYGDQHSSLSEWAWRHILIGGNVEELLDKNVTEASYLNEMCTVFKLGVMCTATLPTSRPSMKDALQILQSLAEPLFYAEKCFDHYYDARPLLKSSKEAILNVDHDSE